MNKCDAIIENLISEKKSVNSRDFFDFLTGFPVMSYFLELSLAEKNIFQREGKRIAMLAFDLNGMKSYNGKYGIDEGNNLLIAFAEILKGHFGEKSCSRFGEDHFYAFADADGIQDELEELFEELKHANNDRSLPVRVGIYVNKGDNITPGMACDRAKIACDHERSVYVSKYYYFDEAMQNRIEAKNYILNNIEQAVNERWIIAYYQPIVRAVNGEVCEEEALARWIDPDKGKLEPAKFIPVLEDAKLLYKIDLYMVDRVIEDLKKKRDAGLSLVPVSVNISRYDFEYCDMAAEVIKRLEDACVEPSLLRIEITESVNGMDPKFIKDQIEKFHEAGIQVWMDDFGSGYSSLNVLQDYDFDLIKLDMNFMIGFSEDSKSSLIMKNVVNLAEELGIDILAEGVETEKQLDFLREIGCDKVQGFYYTEPKSLDVVIEKKGILGREDREQSEYYEKISRTSLHDIEINGDFGTEVDEYFTGLSAGILEFLDDKFYVLRANEKYKKVLNDIYGADIRSSKIFIKALSLEEGGGLVLSAKKCIETGNWEISTKVDKDGIIINAYLRHLAHDDITGADALLIVIRAIKTSEDCQSICDNLSLKIERELLARNSSTDDAIIRITKLLNADGEYQINMRRVMQEMGSIIHPDRILIMEKNGLEIGNVFEWCKDGIIPIRKMMQKMSFEKLGNLFTKFMNKNTGVIHIRNLDEARKIDLGSFFFMRKTGLRRMFAIPLHNKDNLLGYLCAINYELNDEMDTFKVLETVSYFISFRMLNSKLMNQLDNMSMKDALTGLYNRHGLDIKLEEYLTKYPDRPYTMLTIDIDDFKFMNDLYGHDIGDETLKHLAMSLKRIFNDNAVIGRNGGDEFIVLIKNKSSSEAKPLIRELSKKDQKFCFDGKEYRFTISIGYASYPEHAANSRTLFRKADTALYSVKLHGKHGCQIYKPEMKEQKRTRLGFTMQDISTNVPGAILVYQADESGKILFANDELIKMCGCNNFDELIHYSNNSFKGIVSEKDSRVVEKGINDQIYSEEKNMYKCFRIKTLDGRELWIYAYARLVDNGYHGKVFYAIFLPKVDYM
ncbi:PAS domain S-box-containing protein/diguanylate cyclase (GGDEF) domain-containing protein [Lachnospiraceae bacterium KH1T2]|nr:PAS domain S-box-containing protein/diguanylate cyclase (GGDEF) domain-containing protein [Lachnospiraceae bacterium KH1T2]